MKHPPTDKELLEGNQRQLYQINTLITQNVLSLNDLEELIPGWFHLNRMEDFSLTGIGDKLCNYFEVDEQEVYELGFEFLARITDPETQKTAIPILTNLVGTNDETRVVGFFQRIRKNDTSDYELFYTTSKILNNANSIISVTNQLKKLHDLYPKIEKIFEENIILKKYYARFSTLTKREKKIMKLIAEGFTSHEIAGKLFISKLTVDKHRQNIMKKLEVNRMAKLVTIAQKFNLV